MLELPAANPVAIFSLMISTIVSLGAAGLALLFLEMFLPGMIAGVVGACLLAASVIMAYTDLGAEAGNTALLIASTASAGLWWWWAVPVAAIVILFVSLFLISSALDEIANPRLRKAAA